MTDVVFDRVTKVYPGPALAVEDLSLEVGDGEFLILVGPSGCGKTTALRMVAGLEKISDGTISVGDQVINDIPPKDRDIAMVFQNYALYPHMTVEKNLAFGLRQRRTAKAEMRRRADDGAARRGVAGAALLRFAAAALEPGRAAAPADAGRAEDAARADRRDHDLRHP